MHAEGTNDERDLVSLQLFCVGLFLWFEDPMRRLITKSPGS